MFKNFPSNRKDLPLNYTAPASDRDENKTPRKDLKQRKVIKTLKKVFAQ